MYHWLDDLVLKVDQLLLSLFEFLIRMRQLFFEVDFGLVIVRHQIFDFSLRVDEVLE